MRMWPHIFASTTAIFYACAAFQDYPLSFSDACRLCSFALELRSNNDSQEYLQGFMVVLYLAIFHQSTQTDASQRPVLFFANTSYRKFFDLKRKRRMFIRRYFKKLVPRGRLELPRHSALPPQDSVSTNSTTWAQLFLYSKARTLASVFLSVPRFFPAADRRPFSERPAGGRSRTAMPTVDRKTPCVYTVFRLMSSGNRTAVAPPTPPGPKGSNGNGCCRVSGSQKGASHCALFCYPALLAPCPDSQRVEVCTPSFSGVL